MMRAHELGKLVGIPTKTVMFRLECIGVPLKSPSSNVKLLPIELDAVVYWLTANDSAPANESEE